MSAVEAATVVAGMARIHDRIRGAGGDPSQVRILAVTKGFGPDAVRAAVDAGLVDIGENYAQELLGKARETAAWAVAPRWHFIGRLQRNKIASLAGTVSCWQSLDRAEVVDAVARRAPGARVMIQVDAADSPGKGGAAPDQVSGLVAAARAGGLDVSGLMTVGVAGDDDATERCFRTVAELADVLGLEHRSMGMSADLEIAVRAGSTMVRVGTALFGARAAEPGTAVRGGIGQA